MDNAIIRGYLERQGYRPPAGAGEARLAEHLVFRGVQLRAPLLVGQLDGVGALGVHGCVNTSAARDVPAVG